MRYRGTVFKGYCSCGTQRATIGTLSDFLNQKILKGNFQIILYSAWEVGIESSLASTFRIIRLTRLPVSFFFQSITSVACHYRFQRKDRYLIKRTHRCNYQVRDLGGLPLNKYFGKQNTLLPCSMLYPSL